MFYLIYLRKQKYYHETILGIKAKQCYNETAEFTLRLEEKYYLIMLREEKQIAG